ncbi:hypothetical protein Tco_0087515 [Tanacetum coccineum]
MRLRRQRHETRELHVQKSLGDEPWIRAILLMRVISLRPQSMHNGRNHRVYISVRIEEGTRVMYRGLLRPRPAGVGRRMREQRAATTLLDSKAIFKTLTAYRHYRCLSTIGTRSPHVSAGAGDLLTGTGDDMQCTGYYLTGTAGPAGGDSEPLLEKALPISYHEMQSLCISKAKPRRGFINPMCLTYGNTHVKTVLIDVAYSMTWESVEEDD